MRHEGISGKIALTGERVSTRYRVAMSDGRVLYLYGKDPIDALSKIGVTADDIARVGSAEGVRSIRAAGSIMRVRNPKRYRGQCHLLEWEGHLLEWGEEA